MFNLHELLDIFTGKTSMESLASRRVTISSGATTFALAFAVVAFLLTCEFLFFRFVYWLTTGEQFVPFIIGAGIILLVCLVLAPVLLLLKMAATYVWGALHYSIVRFFSNKQGPLNEFNGLLFLLFASITFVQGLLMLIPVIGWIAAGVVHFYALFLMYRFVKAKFNLNDAQAAIVVLLPFDILIALMCIFALFMSFALIGSRLF